MKLKGKNAIVTGVSKGIGLSIVEQLLQKGANVAGWSRNKPNLNHDRFHFLETDVRNIDEVARRAEETSAIFNGQVDILVNNAGYGLFNYIENISVEDWKDIFETNVHAIFYTCKYIVPFMKEQGSGHIVNISSIAGQMGNAQGSAYSGTKFAVRGITESLFKELREWGIKATCVYPGSTKTDFFLNAPGVDAHDYMMKAEDVAEQIIHLIETSDNFLVSDIIFRPLQPKGPRK